MRETFHLSKKIFYIPTRYILHLGLAVVVIFVSLNGAFAKQGQMETILSSKIAPTNTGEGEPLTTIASTSAFPISLSQNNLGPGSTLALASDSYLAKPQLPTTVIPETQRKGAIRHIVQDGETLWSIAKDYGLTTDTLKWNNSTVFSDENEIKPGMDLVIPPVNGIIYTIEAGDTFESIASKYHASADRIREFNEITELVVGNAVMVPDGYIEAPPPPPEPEPEEPRQVASRGTSFSSRFYYGGGSADGLMGSIGYALPYGNCVNEPGVNNPGWGNPINWPISTWTPYIGATALWTYNHTGVVTGIWSDGSIEVRHQNYGGGQHRFPPSAFRGFR